MQYIWYLFGIITVSSVWFSHWLNWLKYYVLCVSVYVCVFNTYRIIYLLLNTRTHSKGAHSRAEANWENSIHVASLKSTPRHVSASEMVGNQTHFLIFLTLCACVCLIDYVSVPFSWMHKKYTYVYIGWFTETNLWIMHSVNCNTDSKIFNLEIVEISYSCSDRWSK